MIGKINNLYHVVSTNINNNQVNSVIDNELKNDIRNSLDNNPVNNPLPIVTIILRGGKSFRLTLISGLT